MTRSCLALLLLAAITVPAPAPGQYLRCGGDVVAEGDRRFEVAHKCGEPAQKDTRTVEREVSVFDPKRKRLRTLRTTVEVEEWTYNFGPHRFLYFIRFEDGVVVDIESGGFGY